VIENRSSVNGPPSKDPLIALKSEATRRTRSHAKALNRSTSGQALRDDRMGPFRDDYLSYYASF